MADNAIRDRLLALAEANLQLQQHGQMNDNQVHDGRTGEAGEVQRVVGLGRVAGRVVAP